MTPREHVLIRGLVDWIALDRIHWDVAEANKGAPITVVQSATLNLIRALVTEGLFEVGDLSGDGGRFIAWDSSIDDVIAQIRNAYVTNFEDRDSWPWMCWLNLTDAGTAAAQAVEKRSQQLG
jgi:hypothetical protein